MESVTALSERILKRFEQHRNSLADKQRQLDGMMKDLLEQRERQDAVAEGKINKIILPRMEELARHFDNAMVEVQHLDAGYVCTVKFAHTPQYPATVRLDIALLPGSTEHLTARYDLSILPELMEFRRNAEAPFTFESVDSLAQWVEDRVMNFIDDYLRLETHPLYQKDNKVIDIVCGMRISSISAASTVARQGRTFYFCSEHCKDVFDRNTK